MNEKDLFLSHNGADKAWVEKLASDIERSTDSPPLKVFFDKWDIKPGENIPERIEVGVKTSRFFGIVMSPEAFQSDWVTLERSMALMRDPSSSKYFIIPLLRKNCELPLNLQHLRYIDFSDDSHYDENLETLLCILRDKPIPRGEPKSFEAVYLQEDQSLLLKHVTAFQRPFFRRSCINEFSLQEMIDAIDDTQAALNTGRLFTRKGNLAGEFPNIGEFKTKPYKDGFKKITSKLSDLKPIIDNFIETFYKINPNYNHHENFYSMVLNLTWNSNEKHIIDCVKTMDQIDLKRNEIIQIINQLLGDSNKRLDHIDLSSSIIKEGQIGDADRIAKHL